MRVVLDESDHETTLPNDIDILEVLASKMSHVQMVIVGEFNLSKLALWVFESLD